MTPELVVVTAHNLTLAYGREIAVCEVNLRIEAGSITAVIGPNGSGKSTLLRAIAGLIEPSDGHLDVVAREIRGGVSFVLQATEVDRSMPISVREVVEMSRFAQLGLVRRPGRTDRAAVQEALERLDLLDLARHQIHELSGGQRQRVLVAQGLAQGAELILLDEPFTGLDVVSKALIVEVLDEECVAGRTVMFSTHDFEDAARCDTVVLMAGRQVAAGPPEEVLRSAPLREAFGGRMIRIDGTDVILDDPHHSHGDHLP